MSPFPQPFRLGEWHAEPTLNRLRRGGAEDVHLEPRVMAVLVYLVQRRGEVVGKEELLREVWNGVAVEDVAVARSISELRRALGDDASNPRFIETIPKRGYRLITPVVPVAVRGARAETDPISASTDSGDPGPARASSRRLPLVGLAVLLVGGGILALAYWLHRPAPRAGERPLSSIAVLPLRDLSDDRAQQFFAQGMTEALTTDLSQIRALRVVSGASFERVSGAPIEDAASRLDVDGLIDGAISRSADSLRLTLRIVERDGTVRWSRSFSAPMKDAFALQGDVARTVAAEIRATVEPGEAARLEHRRPVDSEAYVAYLEGRQAWLTRSPEGFAQARRHFATALERDPSFAPAYAGLAICRGLEANRLLVPAPEAYEEARRAAERALALDPDLAEAHAALALVLGSYDRDLEGSDRELRRAIELEPSDANYRMWMGQGLIATADLTGAIRELEAVLRLDPLFTTALNTLAEYLRFAGHNERALRAKRAREALKPGLPVFAADRQHFEGLIHATEGDAAAAIEAFVGELEIAGERSAAAVLREEYERYGLATALRHRGELDLARLRSRNERGDYVSTLELALAHINAGDIEDSLVLLERAWQEGAPDIHDHLAHIAFDPFPLLHPLRDDPRFDRLLRAAGMPGMSSFRAAMEQARQTG